MINYKNSYCLKVIILLVFLSSVFTVHSQKIKSFYITGNGERSSKNYAKFKRSLYNKDNVWVVHDYYLNDSLQMTGYYLDKKLTQKTDTFKYYYLNGKLSRTVVYKDGLKHGNEKSFYMTGNISRSANFNIGEVFDKWIWYNEDGSIENELDSVNKKILRKYYFPASYVGGKKNLNKYLENVDYPDEDQMSSAYGQTITVFQINEEGNVNDVDIIVHGTEKMDSAIIEHLYKMPRWRAAKESGKYVTSRYVLPIHFSIQYEKKVSLSDEIIAKAFFKSGIDDYKEENYKKAIFKFKQAIRRNNIEAKYYYFTGHCYYKLKKRDFACEYWTIANLLDGEILKKEIKDLCNLK